MIRDDIISFKKTINSNICLVAATKYYDSNDLKILLKNGVNNFGENRVDSFLTKYYEFKDECIVWHFIGHLQRNKALQVINKIDFLHSLDSLELAKIIDKHREKPLNVFVEVSINEETNKDGVKVEELSSFISSLTSFKNINLVGLMMMAIKNSNEDSLHKQFAKLRILRDQIENELNIKIPYLSMGMSDDYKIAISEGATHIRLGKILGK